jgi:ParB family chromosome partitioning protein
MEITLIKTESIVPNEYNPNVVPVDIMAKIGADIAQKGLVEAIIVRRQGDGYVIVDGEHRWRICKELGMEEVPCIIKDYDDAEAKIKTIQLNYMRGQAVPIRLASLIHDLNKEIPLADLARRLPYEEPQLLDSLDLLKLPEGFGQGVEVKAQEEAGELPTVVSFVLYKDQMDTMEEALRIAGKELPELTKNRKAMAMTLVCAEYIERQGVKAQNEAVVSADNNA